MSKSLFSIKLDLVRDDVLGLFDVFWSQELLGARTAGSTLSVVVPLDVDGHRIPLGFPSPL